MDSKYHIGKFSEARGQAVESAICDIIDGLDVLAALVPAGAKDYDVSADRVRCLVAQLREKAGAALRLTDLCEPEPARAAA